MTMVYNNLTPAQNRVQAANLAVEDGDLFEWLNENSHWNDFAESLVSQHVEARFKWTDNQINAAAKMRDKIEMNRALRAAEKPEQTSLRADLAPIREMFETALQNGHKRPTYRAEGLVINRAPDYGRNPGALYVKNEFEDYGGKVVGTEFFPSKMGGGESFTDNGSAMDALTRIAENPLEAAIRYGKKNRGTEEKPLYYCSCCGKQLTNPVSIELGIGPICRGKWGLA